MERPREAGRPPKPRSTRASTGAPIHRRPGTGAGGEPHAQKGRKGALRRALRPSSPSAHRATRGRATQAHATHAHALHGRNAGPARRDPPPSQRGEARATLGKEWHSAPTAGAGGPLPPTAGEEGTLPTHNWQPQGRRLTTRREAAGWGNPVHPRRGHASRIAREDDFSPKVDRPRPPGRPPPSGPQRRRSGTPRGVGGV